MLINTQKSVITCIKKILFHGLGVAGMVHEGWISCNNTSPYYVTGFVGKHLYILQKHSSKMVIFIFNKWVLGTKFNFNDHLVFYIEYLLGAFAIEKAYYSLQF
jgi:hypothetical protein